MPYTNSIAKLLNLQEVFIDPDNISVNTDSIIIPVHTKKSEQTCPCCGKKTAYVHDYRTQLIKDIPYANKQIYLKLRKRRYVCPECGKRFYEKYGDCVK